MKRTIAVVGALALTGFLAACGEDTDDEGPADDAAASQTEWPGADDESGAKDESGADDDDQDETVTGAHDESDGGTDEVPGGGTDDADGETDAVIGDWQEVVAEQRPLAYDVPANWTVEDPGVTTGFQEEDPEAPFGYSPTVGMSSVASYKDEENDCGPAHGQVGTNGMGEAGFDTEMAARGRAINWAEAAYGLDDAKPDFEDPVPEPFEANGLSGHYVVVDVTPVAHECNPDNAQVRVASFDSPSGDDVYNFIVYADVSGEHAPDSNDLDTIISSIRPSAE